MTSLRTQKINLSSDNIVQSDSNNRKYELIFDQRTDEKDIIFNRLYHSHTSSSFMKTVNADFKDFPIRRKKMTQQSNSVDFVKQDNYVRKEPLKVERSQSRSTPIKRNNNHSSTFLEKYDSKFEVSEDADYLESHRRVVEWLNGSSLED